MDKISRRLKTKIIIWTIYILWSDPPKNKDAKRKLNIKWQETTLEHTDNPTYLRIKLDRSLTFKAHCKSISKKIAARNNRLKKLVGTKSDADPKVIRISGLALCYLAGEYACATSVATVIPHEDSGHSTKWHDKINNRLFKTDPHW